MPLHTDGPAPYAPPRAVLDVIEGFRKRDFPIPITVDVLARAGVPESLTPRTLQALRLLDLVDPEGQPSEGLSDLAKAPEAEFPARLAELLRSAYREVFQFVEPREDGPDKIRDAFRVYKPRGQQERMVTLFLGLCAAAGIVEERPTRQRTPRGPSTRPAKPASPKTGAKQGDVPGKTGLPRSPVADDFQPSHPPSSGQHPFIRGLIQELPPAGATWPRAMREKWAKAALATFDLIYELPPDDQKGGE